MKRAKVLYLIAGVGVGGAEKLLLAMTRCLDRSRFEPVVATLTGGELIPHFEAAGVRVYNLDMRHKLDLRAIPKLIRILLKERPAILHTHIIYADFIGRVLGRLCGVPHLVTTLHMCERTRHTWLWKRLDRWSARFNSALVAVSEEVKRSIVEVEGIDPERIQVIPNAIEFTPATADDRSRRRAQLSIAEDTVLIGMVSRLEEARKGYDVLLEAMGRLGPRWPNLRCVFIGGGPDQSRLEVKARALGVADQVIFLGFQWEVPAWLSALDLFVLSSLSEGSPLAVIEAMASAKPIVASDVGGVRELVLHEQTGLLVQPGDVDGLGAAIQRLLTDRPLAQRLGQAAQQRFAQRLDMRHAIRQTEALYERLLRRERVRRIKLLEATTAFDSGGVTTTMVHLIRGLPRERFVVHVATGPEAMDRQLIDRLQLPCHLVDLTRPIRPLRDLRALWQLIRLIRRERYDIVHTNRSKCDLVAGLAARLSGVPCVVSTAHGPMRRSEQPSMAQTFFDALERLIYRCIAHHVLSVSAFTTHDLLRKRKVAPHRVTTVVNGVQLPALDRGATRERLRRALGLTAEQPVVIMVSRLQAPKTPEVLVESIRRLRQQHPDIVCLLVGDGPLAQRLRPQIATAGLQDAVRLLGLRHDVPELLCAADVYVQSTYSEGLPLSVLEAMAVGLPVVASRVGGMQEVVVDGQTGRLVPASDPAALADGIDWLLRDPVLGQAMGQAAAKRATDHFSVERQVAGTQRLFESLLDAQRSAHPIYRPGLWRRIVVYLQEEGPKDTLVRLGRQLLSPFHRIETVWFLRRPVSEPILGMQPRIPCAIRQANLDDLGLLVAVRLQDPFMLAAMLADPTLVCFIALHQDRVVAYQWVVVGPTDLPISPYRRVVHLRADEAYLFACFALRPFRSQGIVPALEDVITVWLRQHGKRALFTDILQNNLPALKTFEKLGCQKFLLTTFERWMGWTFVRCRRPRLMNPAPIRLTLIGDERMGRMLQTGQVGGSVERFAIAFEPGVETYRGFVGRWWAATRLWRRLRASRCEIAAIGGGQDVVLAGLAARLSGALRLTVRVDAALPNGWRRWALQRLIRLDRLLVGNDACAASLCAQGWVDEVIASLRLNVPVSAYNGALSMDEARRQLKLSPEAPVLATATRLIPGSGWWPLLRLFVHLSERLPECQFLVAGDGPLSLLFKRRADELGLAGRLRLIRDGDRRVMLKAADVYLSPAEAPSPVALLEAMASARPVLTVSLEQQHGQPAAIEGWAAELTQLLTQPSLRLAAGQHHLALISDQFSQRHEAAQLLEVWMQLAAMDQVPVRIEGWEHDDGRTVF